MKAAVIDLGTNTFHLIIADLSAAGAEVLYKDNVPVRLGEGRINENTIIPEAFNRGIDTLVQFKQEIDRHQVDMVKAIATSAIRSARNGTDFVAAAKLVGINIEVVSGDQEAEYIFDGVKGAGAIQESSLIMDIGGGSTEFIICDTEKLLWKKSYDIGAARLMQAYFKSDPISTEDQRAIFEHLDRELTELKAACHLYQPATLIGSAGAFETFATLLLPGVELAGISTLNLDIDNYRSLAAALISSSREERQANKGIIPLRVDMIVIAALLTDYVIRELRISALSLSTYDLKMGVLYSLIK